MQVLPTSAQQTFGSAAMQTTGASTSFTHMPMDSWTQRLDSPIGQRFLQAISDTTGISQSDLPSQLTSGTTLQGILQSKGVSFQEVRQAVAGQTRQVQFHGHHHRQGGQAGGTGSVDSAVLGAIAGKLGMQPAGLNQQLNDGKTLAQLASDKGVSEEDLGKAVEDAVQSMLGYSVTGTPPTTTQVPATQVNQTV